MYGSIAGTNALVPGLGTFTEISVPTIAQVTSWLVQGSALIDTRIASAGYLVPVPNVALAYSVVQGLAELYAAAHAVEARAIDTMSGEDENKSGAMFARFYKELALLEKANLDALGLISTTVTPSRRFFRTRQLRRVDGYSGTYEGHGVAYDYPSE